MKKHEQQLQFENQKKIIDDYHDEMHVNNEHLRKKAEEIRIQTSNEVRQEKMNLETIKTANYNKFSKAYVEKLKADEQDREKRY